MDALRIRIPGDVWERDFAGLARDADVAARAAALIEVPTPTDFRRYNDLAALIEQRALAHARRSPDAVGRGRDPAYETEIQHSWSLDGQGGHIVTIAAGLAAPEHEVTRLAVPDPLKPVPRGREEAKARELRLRRAESGEPLVAGNFADHELAEGLHRLARAGDGRAPGEVRILYIDTSEAAPFPAGRLAMADDGRAMTVLKMSLMSGRHQSMDADMHGSWFRNNELSGAAEVNADIDAIAYRLSKRHLDAISTPERPVGIEMHLTGLEPAIVGFFRAVAERLLLAPGSLRVRPRYFSGVGADGRDIYRDGGVWTNQ
jgi:hypothetical protein